MAVPIEKWAEGMVLPCEVTFEKSLRVGDKSVDVNFTITYQNEILAQGWCFIPSEEMKEAEGVPFASEVRIRAVSNFLGDIALCATDIKLSGGWLSELRDSESPFDDVLNAHERVRSRA